VVRLREVAGEEPLPAPPLAGTPVHLTGRYEVLGEVGRGGMGAVLRGRDPALGRDLAIKVLLERHAGRLEVVQRFKEEAQIGGQLQHPGVVPVYELGTSNAGQPYFTMKLVKGVTLASLLRERTSPSADRPRFLKVFEQVCQTVAYTHAKGVIHRDLKPGNVMVGAFGEVQVMDWGLAKVFPPAGTAVSETGSATATREETVIQITRPDAAGFDTRAGDVLGTPAYMSPEQALGEADRLDERCDVFSLGAILCELLTGQPPYVGGDGQETLRKARRADLADALARLDGCGADPELTALARRCLATEPAKRPRHAGDVAREVELYRAGVEERVRRAELERVAAVARAEEARITAREAEAREAAEKKQAQEARARAEAERRARRMTLGLATAALLLVAGGGSGAWVWQQRRATANAQTRLALEQGRSHLDEGWKNNDVVQLEVALSEADKALGLSHVGASAALQEEAAALYGEAQKKLQQAKKNADLLAGLLNVTAPRETSQYVRGESGTMMALAESSVEEQFVQAFRRWDTDVDLDRTPLETLVVRLGEQPKAVVLEIVAGLDTWMLDRRSNKQPEAQWRRLLQLAEALDRDEASRQLRRLLVSGTLEREVVVRVLTRILLPWSALVAVPPGKQAQQLREQGAQAARSRGPVLRLVMLARALEAAGDPKGAERLLRVAVTAQPDREVLLDALGKLLQRKGPAHLEEAIACYRAARALRPQLGIALGQALREARRAAEAEEVFLDLRARQPNNPEMPFYLGNALYAQKKHAKAEAAFKKALALNPDDHEAHNNLGAVLSAQKRYGEAEAAYRRAIALKPDSHLAHNNLGLDLRAQKRYVEAEAAYKKAIALKPDFHPAHANLGAVLSDQKRYAEAEAACRRAIALKPDSHLAHNNLGAVLSDQKRHGEAEVACRRAIALKPDFHLAHFNLGNALYGQNRPAEAEAAYRKAIDLQPDFHEAHFNLGVVLRAQKRYVEAEAAYKKAIALKPDYHEAHNNLGATLRDQKRYAEAEAAHRKAIALKPDFHQAHNGLGLALYHQKRDAEAEAAYRKAIDLQPDYYDAHSNLGVALASQRKLGEAVAAFRCADQLHPGDPRVRANLERAERLVKLDSRLAAVQAGKVQPKDNRERIELGLFCGEYKRQYVAAAALLGEALGADAKLAAGQKGLIHYNGARYAALAAVGKGGDAGKLGHQQRVRLRQQALDWLRADLDAYTALAGKVDGRRLVRQRLTHWLKDEDLTGVRDDKALAALPVKEREQWRKLWADVADLLKKTEDK
jgi:serine/threonine-protein kinase